MSRQTMLAGIARQSIPLTKRFLVGFDAGNSTRQAPGLPNHVSWNLGHVAVTMHRVAEKIDGRAMPESDFVKGDGRQGDARRFDTESVGFGSTPTDDPARYPAVDRALAVFEAAVERLATAAERASDADLDRQFAWGAGQSAWCDLVTRMAWHNGVHAGQIIDLRRALGMKGVLG